MLSNDIKKGYKMVLRGTAWNATMMDNLKGNTRLADVEGFEREIGSIYVWDIAQVLNSTTNQWEPVELTEKQLKAQAQAVAIFGE